MNTQPSVIARDVTSRSDEAPVAPSEVSAPAPNDEQSALNHRALALIDCQKKALELIIAGADLRDTLELLTSALEANAGRKVIATIMLASADGTYLYPAAGKSAPPSWRDYIARVPIESGAGSCGSCAFQRERIVVSDIATDPRWSSYKNVALALGLHACWSTPIVSAEGAVLGTYAIYYLQPSEPSRDEIQMVEMMTRTAAVAIQKASLYQALQTELAMHKQAQINSRRLAAIVESSDDAIVGKDLNGIVQNWNRAAERIFGYTEAEILGRSITLLIPDDRLHEEQRILRQIRSGQRIQHFDTIRRRKDGKLLNVSITVSPIRDAHGNIIGASKIARDITGAKEAETMRNRLAAIVESSDDAIIGLDLSAFITAWNRGAENTFGYSADEAIGQSVTMLIPRGMEDEEPRILARILKGDRVEHYETVRQRKDGSLIDVSLTVSPILDADGKIIGASKISRDITESKRQQEALRRSEEELRAMANSIPQLAWMAHPDGFIYWYNQRWFDYTGTTPQQMEGWGWQSVHDPEILPSVVDYWKRCVQEGTPFEMEFPLRGADGIFRWFLTRVSPFRDQSGQIVRWFGTNTEVDELRRTQQALKDARDQLTRQNHQLEELVAERTAELRDKIQELEAFSYSVSHDLRSPLRAMQGYADALLVDYNGRLDSTAEHYLNRIHRAARRMDILIQDVLAYSRVAKGDIQLSTVNVEAVISDVIANYPPFQSDRASITVHGPIPEVLGHEAYITQIVSNLLGNAVKFIAPGTFPTVHISAREVNDMIRLSFRDNGIGIDSDQQQNLFKIFGRVYSEKQFEGTGIGLAIVKKAAERMGGTAGVQSQLGHGSEFFILLKKA